jgi:hypothetical protein
MTSNYAKGNCTNVAGKIDPSIEIGTSEYTYEQDTISPEGIVTEVFSDERATKDVFRAQEGETNDIDAPVSKRIRTGMSEI